MGNDRKIKILLVCIVNKNYGDTVIARCAETMIKRAFSSELFVKRQCRVFRYSCATEDIGQVKYADAVVFAGGGIVKFQNEQFYRHIYEITTEAERYGVPVFFNAVGVEGFDSGDERCRMLIEALNSSCVKGITVRDDIETMRGKYITNSEIRVRKVLDPAVWTKQVYKNKLTAEKNGCIGLGVARGDIFSDYGAEDITEEYMLDFWCETVRGLEKEGYRWKIFTNGFDSDERFATRVLEAVGHGEKLPQPADDIDFLNAVNSFNAIIATRMHANIAAYSMGVPSVGLVWNAKLKMWGEQIGKPERFIEVEGLTADNVIDALKTAAAQGCGSLGLLRKRQNYSELKRFVKKYCKVRMAESEDINFSRKMLAVGLGGLELKYKNVNSVPQMDSLYAQGFRSFEADVRLTRDGVPVCVNGWSESTYKRLGKQFTEDGRLGLDFDEFIKCRCYGKYETSSFEEFLKKLKSLDKAVGIIDVGKPNREDAAMLYSKMAELLRETAMDSDNVIIRLQRPWDIKLWNEQGYKCRIAYFLPFVEDVDERKAKYDKIFALCKKNKIGLISMLDRTYTDETAELLKVKKLKAIVFSYTKTEDIINSIKRGAYLAGSFYYEPKYIKELTKI